MLDVRKAVLLSTSNVKELTASLNGMIGLPEGTRLDLVPPQPLVEDVSLPQAIEKALANPKVVEAEQTAIKAHVGSAISKLAYVPTVAVTGGYANQNALNVVLPWDFSFIGIVASYTVFDFGKREHAVKEANAQAEAGDLAVQLTKAKVAAAVTRPAKNENKRKMLVRSGRGRGAFATFLAAIRYGGRPAETSSDLPTFTKPFKMAGPTRLELATSCVTVL
jgi:outer membrane protein TolC